MVLKGRPYEGESFLLNMVRISGVSPRSFCWGTISSFGDESSAMTVVFRKGMGFRIEVGDRVSFWFGDCLGCRPFL